MLRSILVSQQSKGMISRSTRICNQIPKKSLPHRPSAELLVVAVILPTGVEHLRAILVSKDLGPDGDADRRWSIGIAA
jgi:hypothetical protein